MKKETLEAWVEWEWVKDNPQPTSTTRHNG